MIPVPGSLTCRYKKYSYLLPAEIHLHYSFLTRCDIPNLEATRPENQKQKWAKAQLTNENCDHAIRPAHNLSHNFESFNFSKENLGQSYAKIDLGQFNHHT